MSSLIGSKKVIKCRNFCTETTKIHLIHHIGLTHQLRARAKERERERRRNSGNNITPGLIPRAVRRNERTSERVVAELENCK